MSAVVTEVVIALLPFAILIAGFLIFKLDALAASIYAYGFEAVVVLFYYHMPVIRALEASTWGNVAIWTGFGVLYYTGQIFGQSYRGTGSRAYRRHFLMPAKGAKNGVPGFS